MHKAMSYLAGFYSVCGPDIRIYNSIPRLFILDLKKEKGEGKREALINSHGQATRQINKLTRSCL